MAARAVWLVAQDREVSLFSLYQMNLRAAVNRAGRKVQFHTAVRGAQPSRFDRIHADNRKNPRECVHGRGQVYC